MNRDRELHFTVLQLLRQLADGSRELAAAQRELMRKACEGLSQDEFGRFIEIFRAEMLRQ